jgi:hypothetical protein
LSSSSWCSIRQRSASIVTDAGARALAGKANFVDLNGIDDWIGGVHLESSKGSVWFRRGDIVVKVDS